MAPGLQYMTFSMAAGCVVTSLRSLIVASGEKSTDEKVNETELF